MAEHDYPNGHLLVSARWLAEHLGDPGLKVIDARPQRDYEAGHVPGALLLPAGAFRASGGVPDTCSPQEFAATAGALGIGPDDTVVCYDGVTGARAWWAFARFGHQRVHVLNCSFRHYAASGGPVSTDPPPQPAPAAYPLAEPQDHLACSLPQAIAAVGKPGVLLWDVRSEAEYTGADPRNNPPHRAGHLPGAVHLEWSELTDPQTGMFKPAAVMRALLASRGITPEMEVVAY